MNWEDERYVRFYTRNTPEWLALTWHARSLFGLLLREVDRAGILKLGKLGLKGAAIAVHAPWVDVEAPLRELLEDGCIVYDETSQRLLVRNFIEAQEAPQSDAARKRASREKARALFGGSGSTSEQARRDLKANAVTNRDPMSSQNVTESHVRSHAVTSGHVESRPVTLNRAVPSVPNQQNTNVDPPPADVSDGPPSDVLRLAPPVSEEKAERTAAAEREVFAYWVEARTAATGCSPKALLFTGDRRRKVKGRLRDGYDVRRLKRAVDGCFASAFHVEAGFTDLELICRDGSHVDRFAQLGDDVHRKLEGREDPAEGNVIKIDWSKAKAGCAR